MTDQPVNPQVVVRRRRPLPLHRAIGETAVIGCAGCIGWGILCFVLTAVLKGIDAPYPVRGLFESFETPIAVGVILLAAWLAFGASLMWIRFAVSLVIPGVIMLVLGRGLHVPPGAWSLVLVPLGAAVPGALFRFAGFQFVDTGRTSSILSIATDNRLSLGADEAGERLSGHSISVADLFSLTTLLAIAALILKWTGAGAEAIEHPQEAVIAVALLALLGAIACGCSFAVFAPGGRVMWRCVGCVVGSMVLGAVIGRIFSGDRDWSFPALSTGVMTLCTLVMSSYHRALGYRLMRLPRAPRATVAKTDPTEPTSPF